MDYCNIGATGLRVSPICLGTMLFGGLTDAATAERMVESMREHKLNFIDTADSYMDGESERLVGRLVRRDRHEWVIATKAGAKRGPGLFDGSLSRKWLRRAIDASLQRLDTDYVDLYYLHHNDPATPLEETVAAIGEIVAAGKALHWGFSNYYGWQIAELVRLADRLGTPRPAIAQPYYNILKRGPELDYLPACGHFGIAVVPYSPIARGVLSGKYRPGGTPPSDSRVARKDPMVLAAEYHPQSLMVADKIRARAEARGMTSTQFALLWVLNNALITSVIAGPRTFEQWLDYVGALRHSLTAEDEAFVDSLVAPAQSLPPGYISPRHPATGRRPRGA